MTSLYVIKREAEAKGLSRKELSALSGVSQGTISNIFSGKTNPGHDTLRKLSIAVFGSENAADAAPDPDVPIPRYSPHLVGQAAEILGVRPKLLRKLIRNGVFAWARAVDLDEGRRGIYLIDRKAFREEFGILLELPQSRMKEDADEYEEGQVC